MSAVERRCVILSAGPVEPAAKNKMRPGDYLIACDAGYLAARELGLEPDLILGDFDSAPRPLGGAVMALPAEKDDTDTHYAARTGWEKGFRQFLLLGALGGRRPEHGLANLATGLWLAKQGAQVELLQGESRFSYVLPGAPARLAHRPGWYFSIFPLEGAAEGVWERGAKYPLQNACLTADFPLGVSNETLPGGAEISVQKGSLLLVETPKEGPAHKNGPGGI